MYAMLNIGMTHIIFIFFFFNDTATTEIYPLSLHDALPISTVCTWGPASSSSDLSWLRIRRSRSEEHTSELQSQSNLVCRLLLEKKKKTCGIAQDSAHVRHPVLTHALAHGPPGTAVTIALDL